MKGRMVAFGAWAVLAAVGLFGTGTAAADDKGDAAKALNGTWAVESHIVGGEAMPAEKRKAMTVTFDGNKFTVKDGDKVVKAGTMKLDTAPKIHTVDLTHTEGDGKDGKEGKGMAMPGIFALDGDALRVCFDTAGKTRPDKFAAPAGSTVGLMVLRRVKNN